MSTGQKCYAGLKPDRVCHDSVRTWASVWRVATSRRCKSLGSAPGCSSALASIVGGSALQGILHARLTSTLHSTRFISCTLRSATGRQYRYVSVAGCDYLLEHYARAQVLLVICMLL